MNLKIPEGLIVTSKIVGLKGWEKNFADNKKYLGFY